MNYESVETRHNLDGGKTVRKVVVKGDTGYKKVTKFLGGKKIYTVKKAIDKKHIERIKSGKFVKGLFKDCVKCNTTRKNQ